MISKELLSKVLGYEVKEVLGMLENSANKTILSYIFEDASLNEGKRIINIYELAHRCKEWASNQGYMLTTVVLTCYGNIWYCEDDLQKTKATWKANSEPEAIFNACQWIMENK